MRCPEDEHSGRGVRWPTRMRKRSERSASARSRPSAHTPPKPQIILPTTPDERGTMRPCVPDGGCGRRCHITMLSIQPAEVRGRDRSGPRELRPDGGPRGAGRCGALTAEDLVACMRTRPTSVGESRTAVWYVGASATRHPRPRHHRGLTGSAAAPGGVRAGARLEQPTQPESFRGDLTGVHSEPTTSTGPTAPATRSAAGAGLRLRYVGVRLPGRAQGRCGRPLLRASTRSYGGPPRARPRSAPGLACQLSLHLRRCPGMQLGQDRSPVEVARRATPGPRAR